MQNSYAIELIQNCEKGHMFYGTEAAAIQRYCFELDPTLGYEWCDNLVRSLPYTTKWGYSQTISLRDATITIEFIAWTDEEDEKLFAEFDFFDFIDWDDRLYSAQITEITYPER